MTTHLSDRDLLRAIDGELPWWRRSRVRAHLTSCEACRVRVDRAAAVLAHAGVRDAGTVADAAVQRARLARSLAAQGGARRVGWRTTALSPRVAVAAGLVTFAVVLGLGRLPRIGSEGSVFLRPRVDLTPGATRAVSVAELCGAARYRHHRQIPAAVQARVFTSYGADVDDAAAYELDYLITPELGGADEPANLWPQPFSWTPWNAYVKDELELYLHAEVCAGRMELATAQREIAGDWIASYQRHFRTATPRRDYARIPLTIADTAMVLSELGEHGVLLQSSHAGPVMPHGLQ